MLNAGSPEFLTTREAASRLITKGFVNETDTGHLFLTDLGLDMPRDIMPSSRMTSGGRRSQ
jgi:Mn-dependent DtxR family transcriptional regulator